LQALAAATDYIAIRNGKDTQDPPHIYSAGASTNVGMHLQPKGTGLVTISDGTVTDKQLRFSPAGSASSTSTILATSSTVSRTITLPDATGTLLYGGGPLGTPSSGTVTNLTGTASININGTVGATTASTGAFTTLSASGLSTLSSGVAVRGNTAPASGAGLELVWDGTQSVIQSYNRTSPAYQPLWLEGGTLVRIGLGGSAIAGFTSTGLGIGTTSPATQLDVSSNTGTEIITRRNGGRTVNTYADGTNAIIAYSTGALRVGETTSTVGANFTERLRIDSSGNVGIGTTSPVSKLDVVETATIKRVTSGNNMDLNFYNAVGATVGAVARLRCDGDNTANEFGALSFWTGRIDISAISERMRITNAGNVGIGMTPSNVLDITQNQNASSTIKILNNSAGTGARVDMVVSNGTAQSQLTTFGTGYSGGGIFRTNGTLVYATGAGGLTLSTDTAQPIYFATNQTERARIDSSGNFFVGSAGVRGGDRFSVSGAGAQVASFEQQTNTSGFNVISSNLLPNGNNTSSAHFWGNTSTVGNWYLYGNGTTSYSSDSRLKKNIVTTRNGYINDLCKLRVVKYNWKNDADGAPQELGLIAQEVEEVFPNLVQDDMNPVETGGQIYKQLKQSVLPFMLLKAVQELNANLVAQVAALSQRLAALEKSN
jgi:hypothetical protein